MAHSNAHYQRVVQAKKKLLIRAHKAEQGCADCDEHDPVVLDLHHRDPSTKSAKLTKPSATRSGASWSARLSFNDIALELEKCDVLCANCHRRRHAA